MILNVPVDVFYINHKPVFNYLMGLQAVPIRHKVWFWGEYMPAKSVTYRLVPLLFFFSCVLFYATF